MTEESVVKITESIPTCEESGSAWTHQVIDSPVGNSSAELMAYLRRRGVILGAPAGVTIQEAPPPPAVEPQEEPLKLPPAATAPRPMLREIHEAYETAQAVERALGRQQAHMQQRYTALVAQLKSIHCQARGAHDRGTAHRKLTEAVGLHDHVAELEAQWRRLQRQRDMQALAVLAAAAAYGECREETRRVLNALRWAQQAAAALPPALAAMALDHACQAHAQLVALLGEAEAQALVDDRTRRPLWLRE